MKIYSWNVNGIRAVWNKGLFQKFVEDHDPDILCLQETKAEQEQSPVDLPQYQEIWNSATKKGYSGTAIFTKVKPLNVCKNIPEQIAKKYQLEDNYGHPNEEGRVLVAEFDDYYICTVYTPNSKGDLSRLKLRHEAWDKAFLEYIKHLEQTKPVIFCGDLNVAHSEDDLARPAENVGKHGFTNEEREGFQKVIDGGMIDTFREFVTGNGHYSWWTAWGGARQRNVGWRIDYFVISEALRPALSSAEIHSDVMGSDHCPISITLE